MNGLEFIPGKNIAFNLVPKKHIKPKTQLITFEQFGLEEGIDYTNLKNVWIMLDEDRTGVDCSVVIIAVQKLEDDLVRLANAVIQNSDIRVPSDATTDLVIAIGRMHEAIQVYKADWKEAVLRYPTF